MRGSDFFIEVAKRPPFSKLHPKVGEFFKEYLAHEKVIAFGDRHVANTHFPPYPSAAFDSLAAHFDRLGEATQRRLYSVAFAVTNRCDFCCWHCYNAGRKEADVPFETMQRVVAELQELGAVMVTLTGGEPLLREDLEAIAGLFDARTCVIVGTTGAQLTRARANALRAAGVFAVGVSLDAAEAAEHDRLRGVPGAFAMALAALRTAGEAGLYPYVVSVATREFLARERFLPFMEFAREAGAREVHLLEPSATGRLAGRSDVLLSAAERSLMDSYQAEVAAREDLPILSSYSYLESSGAFGCGAGLTHLYIDGSGEVCPCQLVPVSFGNVAQEPLRAILDRMGCHFCKPRTSCIGRILRPHLPEGPLPTPREVSEALCARHLPKTHAIPRFFAVQSEARGAVGREELRAAYDRVHGDYDAFWLAEAGGPIEKLVAQLPLGAVRRAFEAGCGTGFGTALLARGLPPEGRLLAVDLSEGMIGEARRRVDGSSRIEFRTGDALAALESEGPFDLVFSSWVLGYIPLAPYFAAAARALRAGGLLAFVVHRENSPREPLEIFGELVAEDPSVLLKQVAFDFPRGVEQVRTEMNAAGLTIVRAWEGAITFRYGSAEAVLEHLLKSGAGTAFYDAIDPARRPVLEERFLRILAERQGGADSYCVVHDYVSCIARKA